MSEKYDNFIFNFYMEKPKFRIIAEIGFNSEKKTCHSENYRQQK